MAQVHCSMLNDVVWERQQASYLLHGEVHVWDVVISSSLHLLQSAHILTAAEHKRAASYYQEKDRTRFIVSRVALRILLGRYVEQPPQAITFLTGANKKPYLGYAEKKVYYNVSHSGDRVVIAVSDKEVGVDVEWTTGDLSIEELLDTCFSMEEQLYIRLAADPTHMFYLLWTRKEALLKATAKGIDDDIAKVPCIDGVHKYAALDVDPNTSWKVSSVAVDANYVVSIAMNNGIATIKLINEVIG